MMRPLVVLAVAAAATLAVNLFVHPHGANAMADGFGFYAWYSGLACAALIGIARLLGLVLSRADNDHDV